MDTALRFGWRAATPLILQNEAAECGLACLAMVAAHHGHRIDLGTLRARHAISLKGTTLAHLVRLAASLKLAPRPLKATPQSLHELRLPCVLHWDFNHFVVLTRMRGGRYTVHDPARGACRLDAVEFARHYTGVALELTPEHDFAPRIESRRLSLRTLIGPLPGLAGSAVQLAVVALALQVVVLIAPFYLQWVIDQVLLAQDRDLLLVIALGFALLAAIQAGVTALRGWMLMVLGTTLNLQLLSRLMRHLMRLPMAWFGKRHIGDVVSRLESANTIERTITSGFIEALIDGVTALATLSLMLVYSAQLTAVALGAAVLYGALRLSLQRPLRSATEGQIVRAARQHSHFLESVRGMQSIKLLAHEEQRLAVWRTLAVDQFNAALGRQRLTLLHQTFGGLVFGLENVITVWIGALLVLGASSGDGFSVGMLLAFIAYKTQFIQRINALIDKGLELRMLRLHIDRIADVALEPAEAHDLSVADAELPADAGIELHNVSFRYADLEPELLSDVSFDVRAGEVVAIVGRSGCGKTTLVKLMLGLLAPTSGSIRVGGVALAQLGLARWRRAVASVMQDDQLFAGSIAENIGFFDTQPDVARIEQCARLAAIHDDIAAMPMRYDTLVGDMGTVLSGGQKQRVLLARALYRRPRILFLDEATSHLDVARERSVNAAVRGLGITCVIVAHRPETIASADRVIVLSGGRVANRMEVVAGDAAAHVG